MNKKSKKRTNFRNANYSSLQQHKKLGTNLVPPLNTIKGATKTSWRDEVAPEMLWAFLLAASLPREVYLDCFRQLCGWLRDNLSPSEETLSEADNNPDNNERIAKNCYFEHTSLAELPDARFKEFLEIILKYEGTDSALGMLHFLDTLPGLARWNLVITKPDSVEWGKLALAIVPALDHHSQISTDIRWLKVASKIVTGTVTFPLEMREQVEDMLMYPDQGNLAQGRPMIRSMELAFRRRPADVWISEFQKILAGSKIIRQRDEKEFEDFIEIEVEENEKKVTVYPVDKERWSYFLQEFLLALVSL